MQLRRVVSGSVFAFCLLIVFWFRAWLQVDNVQRTRGCPSTSVGESHHISSYQTQTKSCNCTPDSQNPGPQIQKIKVFAELEKMENTNTKKVQLLIVTRWRHGSSFTGGLFNEDPNFIYFFEPLLRKVPMDNHRAKIIGEEQVTILHDIAKCNFVNADFKWWDTDSSDINCYWSQDFGSSSLCGFHMKELQLKRNQKLASHLTEELCKSRQHVAIKTVRVPDLNYLKSIIQDTNLNVKIIHLVRDPRAVFLSRENTASVCDMELRECNETENNLNYWKNPPAWLKGHHMLLRYEDLAKNPLEMTQAIYKFLGLEVPVTVKLWLNKMTSLSNTTARAFAWRFKMDYETMRTVQKWCLRPMQMVGYMAIDSQQDLKNPNIPTMKQLPSSH